MAETFPPSAQTLDRYRNYLQLLARAEIAPKIRRRVEPSDIVQETLFEAFKKRDQFRGNSDGELAQWLRQILLNNILDATRAMRRQKRDIGREHHGRDSLEDSAARLVEWLPADQSSPSQHVSKIEQVLRLAEAVSQLSGEQQEAVILHHLQGNTLTNVATIMNRSESAVAGLLYRGLKRVRVLLSEPDE